MDRHSKRVAATLALTVFRYLVLLFSFQRSDMKAMDIFVPGMSSDQDVRIITNAAVDQLASV